MREVKCSKCSGNMLLDGSELKCLQCGKEHIAPTANMDRIRKNQYIEEHLSEILTAARDNGIAFSAAFYGLSHPTLSRYLSLIHI